MQKKIKQASQGKKMQTQRSDEITEQKALCYCTEAILATLLEWAARVQFLHSIALDCKARPDFSNHTPMANFSWTWSWICSDLLGCWPSSIPWAPGCRCFPSELIPSQRVSLNPRHLPIPFKLYKTGVTSALIAAPSPVYSIAFSTEQVSIC